MLSTSAVGDRNIENLDGKLVHEPSAALKIAIRFEIRHELNTTTSALVPQIPLNPREFLHWPWRFPSHREVRSPRPLHE